MIRHALAPVLPRAARELGLQRTLDDESPAVALTFDDGPHPEGTPEILELLAEAQLHATFSWLESRSSAARSWPPRWSQPATPSRSTATDAQIESSPEGND